MELTAIKTLPKKVIEVKNGFDPRNREVTLFQDEKKAGQFYLTKANRVFEVSENEAETAFEFLVTDGSRQ